MNAFELETNTKAVAHLPSLGPNAKALFAMTSMQVPKGPAAGLMKVVDLGLGFLLGLWGAVG